MSEVQVILNGETIQTDLESFVLNEDDVDGELCRAGRDLAFYGNLASDLKAQAANAKAAVEKTDAELSMGIRSVAYSEKAKITEGGIKEQVICNEIRQNKIQLQIQAERDFQKIENLFRSQQKKVDCLIALAYKQRTEIAKTGGGY